MRPEGKGVDGVRVVGTGDVCVCYCTGRRAHLIGGGTHDKKNDEMGFKDEWRNKWS